MSMSIARFLPLTLTALVWLGGNAFGQTPDNTPQQTPPAAEQKLPKIDDDVPGEAIEPEAATEDNKSANPPAAADAADALKGHAITPEEIEGPAPVPQFDLAGLTFAARRMHELLLEAVQSGDIEKLRPYIGDGENMTLLSFGGVEGDPIEFLKSLSGDGEGYEIMAILQDVLQAGFVKLQTDPENEIFVWPYFHSLPIDKLTPAQRVDLYRVVTHGDYEDMKGFGAYNFYRVGITPDGRWQFFVAGD